VKTFKYPGVRARQSAEHEVITITARASDVLTFAAISRAGRDGKGTLTGFQRPQIASHIREIRDYLRTDRAVLPNSVVISFSEGIAIKPIKAGSPFVEVTINMGKEPPARVVDGQQRLTALSGLPEKDFEIFVSILVCKDEQEENEQFIRINSTRPLSKALLYELIPKAQDLPRRLSDRGFAAEVIELLNYDSESSLKGKIHQYTNPTGILRDTAFHKIIKQSVSDGAMREFPLDKQVERSYELLSEFFEAVKTVFKKDWDDHTPKTSRLVHSAGIMAMGFVMEDLVARENAFKAKDFVPGLNVVKEHAAWTSGHWVFAKDDIVPWNGIQNVPRQIMQLSQHLVSHVRRGRRAHMSLVKSLK
jgi:DGQHR domain-containing protein